MTAQINLPILSLNAEDISAAYRFISRIFKRGNRLSFINSEKILESLLTAVNCILDDRFTEGDGKGSWGKSEILYRRYMYGEKEVDVYNSGFLTTVLALQALYKFQSLISLDNQIKACNFSNLWRSILFDFNEYIRKRLDINLGVGFDPGSKHEMDFSIEKMRRHTAWLLRIELIIPIYYKYIEETSRYIINSVQNIDFLNERISTEIAYYSTLNDIKKKILMAHYPVNEYKRHLDLLDRSIRSKYIKKINGWTAGLSEERGRQPYTFFVLTELIEHENILSKELSFIVKEALKSTFDEPWKMKNYNGVCLEPGGDENLGMTLILISILLKKDNLSKYEKRELEKNMDFVTKELIEGSFLNEQFSWTYSYFVRDVCGYLMKEFHV